MSESETVALWDTKTGANCAMLKHPMTPSTMAFSSDGQMLASGYINGTVCLWDTQSGKLCKIFEGHLLVIEKIFILARFTDTNNCIRRQQCTVVGYSDQERSTVAQELFGTSCEGKIFSRWSNSSNRI